MTIPYIMSKDAITVMVNGNVTTVSETHANFLALREAVRNKDWERVPDLIAPARAVERMMAGRVTVKNGQVVLDGEIIHNAVTDRILDLMREGFDAEPLMRFLERLMQNPSRTAVNELYLWLEGTRLPITEDGYFMAYKKVNSDYKDFYTGQILNKPAALMNYEDRKYIETVRGNVTVTVENDITTLTMPRNKVDDNRENTCSYGLHFCSLSYLPHYHGGQGRVLLVKIDPADVVSIPSDYDNAKGRAWRYQIMGEHMKDESTEAYNTPVATARGEPITSSVKTAAQAPDTWVMGINFGTETRAAMVRDLMRACAGMNGPIRDVNQARVDGFDDAWDLKPENLSRCTGNHMREAAAYAQAYFEGYDRCRGHAPQVQATVPDPISASSEYGAINAQQRDAILAVLKAPVTGRETYHGSKYGNYCGSQCGHNHRVDRVSFDLSGALYGGNSFRKAYVKAYTKAYNN